MFVPLRRKVFELNFKIDNWNSPRIDVLATSTKTFGRLMKLSNAMQMDLQFVRVKFETVSYTFLIRLF